MHPGRASTGLSLLMWWMRIKKHTAAHGWAQFSPPECQSPGHCVNSSENVRKHREADAGRWRAGGCKIKPWKKQVHQNVCWYSFLQSCNPIYLLLWWNLSVGQAPLLKEVKRSQKPQWSNHTTVKLWNTLIYWGSSSFSQVFPFISSTEPQPWDIGVTSAKEESWTEWCLT